MPHKMVIILSSYYLMEVYRIFIDDQLHVDAWQTIHTVKESFQYHLTVGLHKIHVDYKERQDNTYITVNWYTPWKGLFEPIPEEYFYIPKDVYGSMAKIIEPSMYGFNNTTGNEFNNTNTDEFNNTTGDEFNNTNASHTG